jgi:hypothetical protein
MKPVKNFTWQWLVVTTAISLIVQLFTTGQPLTLRYVTVSVVSAILAIALLLFLFGWLPYKLLGFKAMNGDEIMIDLQHGEQIKFQGPANHIKGIEAVGGKIYLTNQRLFFRSHKWNFQNHSLSIPLEQIGNMEERLPRFAVKKRLIVKTTNGKCERFVLERLADFSRKLDTPLIAV